MKFSILVIMTIAFAFSQNINVTEARSQKSSSHKRIISDCAAKEGATKADIKQYGTKPTTKSGKCLYARVVEKYERVKNNKLVYDNSVEVIKNAIIARKDNQDALRLASEIVNDCVDVTDEDQCEAPIKILTCLDNASKARGIDFDQ